MTREEMIDALAESEAVVIDGMDDALIGVGERFGDGVAAVYDLDKMIQILIDRDGMDYPGAVEFVDFNILGAFFGDPRPVFLRKLDP